MKKKSSIFGVLIVVLMITLVLSGISANASTFNQNNLMDDPVFNDKASMLPSQIDTFLNSYPSSCISTNNAFYTPDPTGWSSSVTTNHGYTFGGRVSAGQAIYDAAQLYDMNPQVILATMQKEQSVVSGSAGCHYYNSNPGEACPYSGGGCVYIAMSYACPSGCSADYSNTDGTGSYGIGDAFSLQLIAGTWLLRWSQERSYGILTGYAGFDSGDDSIWYSGPMTAGYRQRSSSDSSNYYDGTYTLLDGTSVSIDNGPTAALYFYTPFLSGNESFDNIFSQWFGSQFSVNGSVLLSQGLSLSPSTNLYAGDVLSGSYQIQNTASYAVDDDGFGICARVNGQWYDFGFTYNLNLPANSTVNVTFSKKLDTPGSLLVYVCSYDPVMGWPTDYPYDNSGQLTRQTTVTVQDNPLITTGIGLSPTTPTIGVPETATFTIHNASSSPMDIGSMVLSARDPNGNNVDFPIVNDVTVPASGDYTYSQTRTFSTPGLYSLVIANWNGTWKYNYPTSASTSIVRQTTVTVQDNPLITTGIGLSPTTPTIGVPETATFTIHNASSSPMDIGSMVLSARDPNGNNVDFPIVNDVTVPASGDYTYSQTRTFSTPGLYSLVIANWNGTWKYNYPTSASTSIVRQTTVTVQDNPLITTGIGLSPTTPTIGVPETATFTIHNASSSPMDIGSMVLSARDPNGNNVDFPIVNDVTVPASGDYTYSQTRTFSTPGLYSLVIANWNGTWKYNYPTSASTSIVRQTTVTVQQ